MQIMEVTKSKFSLKKNDMVQVIAGKDKGKSGKILDVDARSGRVTVEKVNMVKRHSKASQKNPQGGVILKEKAVHYSNVQLMCPKCNRGVRFGVKLNEKTGKKTRVCKKCEGSLGE
jgi:large subunit ribosomal protein L24